VQSLTRSAQPLLRPVYKSIHQPLSVCGVDRRLFFLALMMGAATFNLFYSFVAGVLTFVVLYVFGIWATRRDPKMLQILMGSSRFRRRYDPLKHKIVAIEVQSC
jgi:type IV secretory pathway TrbD component